MATQKRKMDDRESEASTIERLRSGELHILSAITEELPDVFTVDILPKLDAKATFNLAQVNKWYNSAVWSVDGVRSIEAKMNLVNTNRIKFLMRWAAEHGNVPAVRACLESGVDVDKVLTSDNRTALHVAALHGRAALAKALIEAGADVNKLASPNTVSGNPFHNVTPLYLAADQGHTQVVMELIKAGADLNQATSEGSTPLYIAAQNGHESCVALLIQAGADVRKACKGGWTPMKVATYMKREKVVTLLKFWFRNFHLVVQ
jgi:hypothetical protein|tara:strand:- start:65 stop:850 length:786 start_codon:yes stop_codon:yes gene_type:complete